MSRSGTPRPCETLTLRERQAAALLAYGLSPKSIATAMEIRHQSARNLLWRAYRKAGASNRVELVRWVHAVGGVL